MKNIGAHYNGFRMYESLGSQNAFNSIEELSKTFILTQDHGDGQIKIYYMHLPLQKGD